MLIIFKENPYQQGDVVKYLPDIEDVVLNNSDTAGYSVNYVIVDLAELYTNKDSALLGYLDVMYDFADDDKELVANILLLEAIKMVIGKYSDVIDVSHELHYEACREYIDAVSEALSKYCVCNIVTSEYDVKLLKYVSDYINQTYRHAASIIIRLPFFGTSKLFSMPEDYSDLLSMAHNTNVNPYILNSIKYVPKNRILLVAFTMFIKNKGT